MTTKRYVTILATVEVPNDDVWDQILSRQMSDLVEANGLQLAPCDFTIDLDTLTDQLDDAEYGTVTLLDMNPPRVHPVEDPDLAPGTADIGYSAPDTATMSALDIPPGAICIEATCGKCGEAYNPEFPDDDHAFREDGEECGGKSTSVGWWRTA